MSLDDFDKVDKDEEKEVLRELNEKNKKYHDDLPVCESLNISKDEWSKLKKEKTGSEIRDYLVDIIRKNDIPPPYTPYIIDEIKESYEKMKNFNTKELFTSEEYYIKHPIKEEWNKPMGIMLKMNNTGNKSSNYFHQKSRFKASSSVADSVEFTWNYDKLLRRTLKALWSLKIDRVNYSTLQTIIQLRGYIPSQFKPVVAKAIYDYFEAESTFDMSMGWGDRIAGFSASKYGEYYYGADPSTVTFQDYKKQIEFYNDGKKYDLYNLPAESLTEEPKEVIDLAFSSPPYFTKEHYSNDPNQSWKKYPQLFYWIRDFLLKSIDYQWKFIKSGGTMIVNISDVYINGEWNVICDPMNDHISKYNDSEYVGHMGMKMAKRPNVHSAQDGNFAEPMWVWRKK